MNCLSLSKAEVVVALIPLGLPLESKKWAKNSLKQSHGYFFILKGKYMLFK